MYFSLLKICLFPMVKFLNVCFIITAMFFKMSFSNGHIFLFFIFLIPNGHIFQKISYAFIINVEKQSVKNELLL